MSVSRIAGGIGKGFKSAGKNVLQGLKPAWQQQDEQGGPSDSPRPPSLLTVAGRAISGEPQEVPEGQGSPMRIPILARKRVMRPSMGLEHSAEMYEPGGKEF